jgi:hypothetical protein
MGCENATEVRSNDFDLVEGNMVDGFRAHVSRMCENRKRMKIPFARTTDASVLDSRLADEPYTVRVSQAHSILQHVEYSIEPMEG